MYGLTTVEEWTAVLRLASLWNCQGIRSQAIDALNLSVSSYQRLVLARAHDVQDWIEPAFEALSERANPLSVDEARALSIEDVILIATARENALGPAQVAAERRVTVPAPANIPPLPKLTSKFTQEELKKISHCLSKDLYGDALGLVTMKKLPAFYHAIEDFTDIYSGKQSTSGLVQGVFQHVVAHPSFISRAVKVLSFVAHRVGAHGGSIRGSVQEKIQDKMNTVRGVWTRFAEAEAKYPDFDMALRSATRKQDGAMFKYMLTGSILEGNISREEYEQKSEILKRLIEALSADDVRLAR